MENLNAYNGNVTGNTNRNNNRFWIVLGVLALIAAWGYNEYSKDQDRRAREIAETKERIESFNRGYMEAVKSGEATETPSNTKTSWNKTTTVDVDDTTMVECPIIDCMKRRHDPMNADLMAPPCYLCNGEGKVTMKTAQEYFNGKWGL